MSWFDQLISANSHKQTLVAQQAALPGRATAVPVAKTNVVLGHPMQPQAPDSDDPWGQGRQAVVLGGGCFWGVEEIYWQVPGVYTTAVGYAGGYTPNASYEEVCTAQTGHTEAVLVVFDPKVIDLDGILKIFWESHDPTQDMRQGNDVGTQYRSAIYTVSDDDARVAQASADRFAPVIAQAGLDPIATEIKPLAAAGDGHFYYAEDYHQQYLAKNPNGYRCHSATGLKYPA
ncbi:peptide-methionine (S)-S-oxide reductase MsrA [Gordonia sp. CPCC 205333]|uniref:peptide-methionine (S)-S-oxide reductase MsrA n=1 Tax=Gordonia sp. CPCC 205333 TaxID=3140790 RepID=UPI003AF332A0